MTFSPQKVVRSRVIFLAGEEDALRRRALDQLLEAAEIAKDDFDLESFDADSRSPSEWVAAVSTSPFLANRRTAVVRHVLRVSADQAKTVNLGDLPETALLILVADDESGSDDKQQRLKTVRKGWEKLIETTKGTVLAFDPDPKAARAGMQAEVQRLGKTISDKALEALVEMTGGSLSRGLAEVEKLVLYVGNADQIRESDVRTVVVPSRDWNVFKMVDAIIAGEVPEALRQLRTLVGSAGKAEDAAMSRILPQLSRSLRLLWQARLCIDARCQPNNAPAAVQAMFPEKPNLAKESPYRQTQTMTSARKTSLPVLQKCLQILCDTDARLKGSLDSFNAIDTLERMVLEMSQAIRQ